MSIATSLDKLSETLTNCKTNLKEKGVESDNIKISDVDEKIMEIESGGGTLPLNYIENVQFQSSPQTETNPCIIDDSVNIEHGGAKGGTLSFKVKIDCKVYPDAQSRFKIDGQLIDKDGVDLTSGQTKTVEVLDYNYATFSFLLFGKVEDYSGSRITPDIVAFKSYMYN